MKNTGALISFATRIIREAWISIQMPPTTNRPGISKIARMFIFMPIEAISTQSSAEPIREAPTPSSSRALVVARIIPRVVAITTSQKKWLVRLKRSRKGAFCARKGASRSAQTWEKPVTPKPTASTIMVSLSLGMRVMLSW